MSTSPSEGSRSAPTWLERSVYEPKRRRTVELTSRAIDALERRKTRVSLASIARESVGLDPEGRGVSEDAILDNPAAYAEYVRRRTWNRASARAAAAPPGTTIRVRVDRDPVRARRQYLRMPKEALVARLVSVEAAYAALEEQRLRESDLKLADWEQRRRTDRTD